MRQLGAGLVLMVGVATAHAEAPAPGPPPAAVTPLATPPPLAKLRGRVFVRGSLSWIVGATITASTGDSVTTDERGGFELLLPPGPVDLLIAEERHESLRVTERLLPGQGVAVEYRLLPLPAFRRRYETTVRGQARREGARFSLQGDELQTVPGALGEPFRVIGLLPGVATPLPLLPLWVVRGASPGANGFFLDGMRVPQLFHFLLLGEVAHPRLIDRLDFYPGGFGAEYGHLTGGVAVAETRPARCDARAHGEIQLRAFDAQLLAEACLPKDIRIVAGGKIGFPGWIISLIQKDADLFYWDYQVRADWKGLTLQALGSYDRLKLPPEIVSRARVSPELRISFHRLQLRERYRGTRVDLDAQIFGGVDEMAVLSGQGVRKLALGARLQLRLRLGRFTVDTGFDGEVSRFEPANFTTSASDRTAPDQLGELGGTRDGFAGGVFASLTVELWRSRLWATLSGRADLYTTGTVTVVGLEPRLNVRMRLLDELWVKANVGVFQQPPSFPIALPGIDTYALQLGLQRSDQGSAGIEARLPYGFSFDIAGFFQKLTNVNDVVLDLAESLCTSPPPESLTGLPAVVTRQLSGQAFGMELLLRRRQGRVTGWIAYTLSRSERLFSCGLQAADFDQGHILNLVVQAHLPWRLVASARFNLATGRPYTKLDIESIRNRVVFRNNERLPTYFQLDLRIDREFLFKKWALGVFVEIVNSTCLYPNLANPACSQQVIGIDYPEVANVTRYDMPTLIQFPFVLPSLGINARF